SGAPIGVAPGATVVVAKAMDAAGAGRGSDLIAAAQWMTDPDGNAATDDFPVAVNNSWSADDANDPWFDQVVRSWVALGILAALVKQAQPSIGPTEIADLLRRTAVDLGPTGPDPSYGAGLVDALAAVSAVSATPPAAPAPTPVPVPAPAGEPTPTTPVPPGPAAPE